jgi:hypothetical protein
VQKPTSVTSCRVRLPPLRLLLAATLALLGEDPCSQRARCPLWVKSGHWETSD